MRAHTDSGSKTVNMAFSPEYLFSEYVAVYVEIWQGVARVAKATPSPPLEKKIIRQNNLFYLQHSHCTLNCTQSFNGRETS